MSRLRAEAPNLGAVVGEDRMSCKSALHFLIFLPCKFERAVGLIAGARMTLAEYP
jgi:hypothetical protein